MIGMDEVLIIETAIAETAAKNFDVTKAFLKVHKLVYVDKKPVVARVDTDKNDGTAIVYFSVKDQKFYFAVYVEIEPETLVSWVATEPYYCIYFKATSEKFDLQQLASMTTLKPTSSINKGDKRGRGTVVWKYSKIQFEPNPEADEFEDKLLKLLAFLEQDKEGVKTLVEKAKGYIQVATSFHNADTMLGGHQLNKNTISRMAALHLGIDFDLHADGKSY